MPARTTTLTWVPAERLREKFKAAAKKLLPERVVNEVARYRAYPKVERSLYLHVRVLSSVGLAKPKLSPPNSTQLFVFVCFGNIMRSPMCEALMNRECAALGHAAVSVTSAGLHSIPGREAHPWAIAAARDFGISLEEHRARPLTPEVVARATVIFTMDFQNQVQLLSRYPEAKDKTFLLSVYAGEKHRSAEIPDPYYLGEEGTRRCYQTLTVCIRNLARSLSASAEPGV